MIIIIVIVIHSYSISLSCICGCYFFDFLAILTQNCAVCMHSMFAVFTQWRIEFHASNSEAMPATATTGYFLAKIPIRAP